MLVWLDNKRRKRVKGMIPKNQQTAKEAVDQVKSAAPKTSG